MINNLLKNFCLITFGLIAPITLPAGGIQKSIKIAKGCLPIAKYRELKVK